MLPSSADRDRLAISCSRRRAARAPRRACAPARRRSRFPGASRCGSVRHSTASMLDARHRRRERLRAAHAAQARRQYPFAGERAAEMAAAHLGEGFVGPLDDALAADVDPGAGGHLPVHGEALCGRARESAPRWPSAAPDWNWRSARAARPRGSGTRRPVCRIAPARFRPRSGASASRRCGRSSSNRARRDRCRRRRRVRRDSRRLPDRDCSSACAAAPRSSRSGRSACCRVRRESCGA